MSADRRRVPGPLPGRRRHGSHYPPRLCHAWWCRREHRPPRPTPPHHVSAQGPSKARNRRCQVCLCRQHSSLEDDDIRAHVPLPEWDKSSPYVHIAAFTYDADEDVYRCPQGQVLKLEWIDEAGERKVYRARAATCNACPVKEQCTRSKQGRLIGRSFHAAYVERVRGYQETPAYQKAIRKRSVGRATLCRSETVARPEAIPAKTSSEREYRGVAGGQRTEPQALAPGNRLGTTDAPGPSLGCSLGSAPL